MLEIKNVSININEKQILNNFNLKINNNEIHVIMGPNGVGKSTICKIIMGDLNFNYEGDILFLNENLKNIDITQRARKGIYLLNQNPIEIEGVTNSEMLRLALNEISGKYVPIFDFNKKMQNICEKLNIPQSFIHREINVGMSGGERKKNELLHLFMLEPKLIILDELDSGLDVDSLKTVSEALLEYYENHDCSILIITHHDKIIDYLKPNYIHILSDGQIKATGGLELVEKINKNGFKNLKDL